MQPHVEDSPGGEALLFNFATIPAKDRSKLLLSTVVPRPIAWIVSLDRNNRLNAAPFSFFNVFAADPPVVGIGIGSHGTGHPRDTRVNIQDTGEFIVNLVSEEMVHAMNITAITFKHGVNELSKAGLETRPSAFVKPPRIAGSPVAMECSVTKIVDLSPQTGLVLGRVLAMHIRKDIVIDTAKHYVDTPQMHLIGRMHSDFYARTSSLLQVERISERKRHVYKEQLALR